MMLLRALVEEYELTGTIAAYAEEGFLNDYFKG